MKKNYRVICELKNETGELLKEQIHECRNIGEVLDLTEIACRCGWIIRDIIELK